MEKGEGIMDFKYDTIYARNCKLSKEDMRKYRIRGVYNSICDTEYFGEEYIDRFAAGVCRKGSEEVTISETGIKTIRNRNTGETNSVRILSVIVFADVHSMELFVLANQGVYMVKGQDKSMGGRLN
jgi:hypothetical protein